jgi:hypothetical protein
VDLPDQPDETSRAERARDASAARPRKREMPDPDERGRAYEATRVHASADATAQGSYWDKVPKFGQIGQSTRDAGRNGSPLPNRSVRPIRRGRIGAGAASS